MDLKPARFKTLILLIVSGLSISFKNARSGCCETLAACVPLRLDSASAVEVGGLQDIRSVCHTMHIYDIRTQIEAGEPRSREKARILSMSRCQAEEVSPGRAGAGVMQECQGHAE